MPAGLGVLILLVLVALGGGVAVASSKKKEPEPAPPAPPAPEPPTFQPQPPEPARLPPSKPSPTYYTPTKAPSAKDAKMRKLKKMVDALGPEPAVGKIVEASILADEVGATETINVLKDRLQVAIARGQEYERLHSGK